MDAINCVNDSFGDRRESEMSSSSESSSTSRNQSDSSSEYSRTVKEAESSETQHDSEHTIGPLNLNSDSKLVTKSERQPVCSSLIPKNKIKACFSYNENKKECWKPHIPKDENIEEDDENSENYIDRYLRKFQGESFKKKLRWK